MLAALEARDTEADLAWTAAKIATLRVFPNGPAAYDLDVNAVGGAVLLVSNFTVAADVTSGRRPALGAAMKPGPAAELFERFVTRLRALCPRVACGEFGADMVVSIENDGPLTLVVRSPDRREAA